MIQSTTLGREPSRLCDLGEYRAVDKLGSPSRFGTSILGLQAGVRTVDGRVGGLITPGVALESQH